MSLWCVVFGLVSAAARAPAVNTSPMRAHALRAEPHLSSSNMETSRSLDQQRRLANRAAAQSRRARDECPAASWAAAQQRAGGAALLSQGAQHCCCLR